MAEALLQRTMRWLVVVLTALLAGAGLGFVARDLLGLDQPAVAVAWLLGVALSLTPDLRRRGRRR
jgi:hypothetical protein